MQQTTDNKQNTHRTPASDDGLNTHTGGEA